MKPNTVGRCDGAFSVTRHCDKAAGLLSGALILTMDGELPVEYLNPGDRIITRDTGVAILHSITARQIVTDCVTFAAGSLGHNKPGHDCRVPAGQQVLLRDARARSYGGRPHCMVAARDLVDGEYVTLSRSVPVTLLELRFERPHILYVDGMELASFEDHFGTVRAA